MQVPPIQTNQPTFGYSNPLKTLYKKGKFPKVEYGFYGDKLTKDTVTLEHLKPKSQGGKTELSNLVLVSANKNQERGVRPLEEMFNWDNAGRYFQEFKDVKVGNFDGNAYIKMIVKTIYELMGAK
jgi:hypothetical protein